MLHVGLTMHFRTFGNVSDPVSRPDGRYPFSYFVLGKVDGRTKIIPPYQTYLPFQKKKKTNSENGKKIFLFLLQTNAELKQKD